MSQFDEFWAAFPNKKSKGAARKAFPKALARVDMATIMAGLEAYKAGKEDWRAWMHPATWLNGECWEDEYETEPEVAACFRPFDTWSQADKDECAATIEKVGLEKAMQNYRYSWRQIQALKGREQWKHQSLSKCRNK